MEPIIHRSTISIAKYIQFYANAYKPSIVCANIFLYWFTGTTLSYFLTVTSLRIIHHVLQKMIFELWPHNRVRALQMQVQKNEENIKKLATLVVVWLPNRYLCWDWKWLSSVSIANYAQLGWYGEAQFMWPYVLMTGRWAECSQQKIQLVRMNF